MAKLKLGQQAERGQEMLPSQTFVNPIKMLKVGQNCLLVIPVGNMHALKIVGITIRRIIEDVINHLLSKMCSGNGASLLERLTPWR